ncbi:MAG: Acyl-CoA dehydrogenase, short-chain specific, partial [Conexibacter sp.]|nr:Acyl-CoA dehydrogenase, short-chain specific [Conexibacter sp.]
MPASPVPARAPSPSAAGSGDVQLLVDAVRAFGRKQVLPGVLDRDREERFPRELVREAGALDLLGGTVPERYGGPGLSYTQYAAVIEEMARFDQVVALAMTLPSGLAGAGLLRHGSEQQRQALLPPLCSGESVAAVGVTEPASGTDVAAMQTTCRRDGEGYRINGAKTWTSQLAECDWVLTFATLDRSLGRRGVCAFVIPRDTPGLTFAPFHNKLGFRAVSTGDVFLEDVSVPESARVGDEGDGFAIAMAAVETGRLGVAARALGIAQDCLDRSVAYANERHVGGGPIARYQLVQSMICDMVIGIEGARAMVRDLADKRDRGVRARREASLAKMHASDVALMCATHAVQIHGAYGVHEDYHVGRH